VWEVDKSVGFFLGWPIGELLGLLFGSAVGGLGLVVDELGLVTRVCKPAPNVISISAYSGITLALMLCTLTTKSNREFLQLLIVSLCPATSMPMIEYCPPTPFVMVTCLWLNPMNQSEASPDTSMITIGRTSEFLP